MIRPGKPRTNTRPRHKPGRGALWLIALLLFGSGLIRMGEGAGKAFALASEPSAASPADAADDCAPEGGVMLMLEELKQREKRVVEREGLLADRAQTLKFVEERVELQLATLIAAEEELARTVAIADRAAEKDVARLVTLYENMKPKEAAPLFEEMAPEFAAGFLSRMRPDAAASVLAAIDPKKAYSISVLIAGRNANGPKN